MGSELLRLLPPLPFPCRLVNKTWTKVIKEGVWGNKRARKSLEDIKLLHKTTNPETVQLGTVPQEIQAFFCNQHVFCGIEGGKVKVYTLVMASG